MHAASLEHVADLLGIERSAHKALPPAELVEKFDAILSAAQRYLRAFPPEHIGATVPRREQRDMRQLGYHVFAIADDLIGIKEGGTYVQGNGPVPESVRTFDDIVAYGDDVRGRLRSWYAKQAPELWSTLRTTSYGAFPMHWYLERATWHSGQHSRQLIEMLRSAGVEAPDALPARFFAGLPMPNAVWD